METTNYWIPDTEEGWVRYTDLTHPPPNALEGDACLDNVLTNGNLANLRHLNEATILASIRHRYDHNLIYTFTNEVLIAVNPYQSLNLYTLQNHHQYLGGNPQTKPPHVYSLAGTAYSAVQRTGRPQSILVNGESGSGKTETTKYIMKFLSHLSAKSNSGVERVFLESNPILEAFGNARTLRNLNSSRFGKYATLRYHNADIIGVNLQTYLLEKVRLVNHTTGEANFHIIYGLLNSPHVQSHPHRNLFFQALSESPSTSLGNYKLQTSHEAMRNLGFDEFTVKSVYNIILGLIIFKLVDPGTPTCQHLSTIIYELLGLSATDIHSSLTVRQFTTGTDTLTLPIPTEEGCQLRDTLIKGLYNALFQWTVAKINEKISGDGVDATSQIGILDIFGFEVFTLNSFEQLCINYTNEQLQNLFNQRMIELQQVEYLEEGLTWQPISCQSNTECLLELDQVLFPLMDEESRKAGGTDLNFIGRVKRQFSGKYLKFPRQDPPPHFTVRHFASDVTYTVGDFTHKNADRIHPNLGKLLQRSENALVQELVLLLPIQNSGTLASKSVSHQFRTELTKLLTCLQQGDIHYVRCLKPNSNDNHNQFNSIRVLEQLRYSGVVEAVRVSRLGYPVRIYHAEFTRLYRPILNQISLPSNQMFHGTTKVFLKQQAYLDLETQLTACQHGAVVVIINKYRQYLTRKRYLLVKKRVGQLQNWWRIYLAKWLLHQHRSARILQQTTRRVQARHLLTTRRRAQLTIITLVRSWINRRHLAINLITNAIGQYRNRRRGQAIRVITRWMSQCYTVTRNTASQNAEITLMSQADLESKALQINTTLHQQEHQYQSEIKTLQKKLQVLHRVHQSNERVNQTKTDSLQLNIDSLIEQERRSQTSKLHILREMESVVTENDKMRHELEYYRNKYGSIGSNCQIQ